MTIWKNFQGFITGKTKNFNFIFDAGDIVWSRPLFYHNAKITREKYAEPLRSGRS